MPDVKYPHVKVQLVGKDGNVFAILGRVRKAMRDAGIPAEEISAFMTEATTAGNYDDVLGTVIRTVDAY